MTGTGECGSGAARARRSARALIPRSCLRTITMSPVLATMPYAMRRDHSGGYTSWMGLPRFDGQGWWLGQATCLMTSSSVAVSNSSGVR
jgi:hypothetical protein